MPTMFFQRRHLRQVAFRHLTIVSGLGGLLTFLFGAWLAPWLWEGAVWLMDHLLLGQTPRPFPSLAHVLAAPNLRLGGLWLAYYLLTFLWAMHTRSPHQVRLSRASWEQEHRHHEWSLITDHTPPARQQEAPLSQAWPGELKHQLVERCYEHYRTALKRFDPPPIELKTPSTFFYRKASQVTQRGGSLVLPEAVLVPERIHELLPFLAHALYDEQEQIGEEDTDSFPDDVPLAPLLALTGNFLWLPVALKHHKEQRLALEQAARQRNVALERDAFAVLLGQGPALEHQLRRLEEALTQRGEMDRSRPTLIERIGRLEVLNGQERQTMRKLGLPSKASPLLSASPLRQLGKGRSS